MGHKAQTTHWEVLELLAIWFSLCRKRIPTWILGIWDHCPVLLPWFFF